MTAHNWPGRALLRASAAARMRWSLITLSFCCTAILLCCARTALAQPAARDAGARAGRTPWQRYSKGAPGRAPVSVARRQTPAEPQVAPEYSGGQAPEATLPSPGPEEVYGEGPHDAAYPPGTTIDGSQTPIEYQDGEFTGGGQFTEGGDYMSGEGCAGCAAGTCDGSCGNDTYSGVGCQAFPWHRMYARADYLLWFGKGFWAPPLVTTSVPGTSRTDAGILGLPGTSVLFPTGNLADAARSGGRIRLGLWFDECEVSGIEGSYFAFSQATTNFNASQDQYPILARPFINIETNAVGNDAELVAYPNLFSGNINVAAGSTLQGAELFFRHALCRGCDWRVDALLGWRFNRLDENLAISDTKSVLSGQTGLAVGTVLSEWDRFSTRNYFNGVQIGVITEVVRCRWWFETRGTIALGNNRSIVNIDGQTTVSVPVPNQPNQVVITPAGLLAQSTNIGQYQNDEFAIVPQLGVTLGYEVICGLWATVGYNFMYWSRVARPGEQIDPELNLSQLAPGGLVGLARPSYTDAITDYWAQGLTVGLAYRF